MRRHSPKAVKFNNKTDEDRHVQIIEVEDGIEIINYDGKNKITVKHPRIPIEVSGTHGELEELTRQIMSMTVVPDFGYQEKNYGDDSVAGWRLLYDYVKKSPKMIKLQNLVKKRLEEKQAKEKLRQQQLQAAQLKKGGHTHRNVQQQ